MGSPPSPWLSLRGKPRLGQSNSDLVSELTVEGGRGERGEPGREQVAYQPPWHQIPVLPTISSPLAPPSPAQVKKEKKIVKKYGKAEPPSPSGAARGPSRAPGRGPRYPSRVLPAARGRGAACSVSPSVSPPSSPSQDVAWRGMSSPGTCRARFLQSNWGGFGGRRPQRGAPVTAAIRARAVTVARHCCCRPGPWLLRSEAPLLAPCTSSMCLRYPSSYHPTRPELVPPSAAVPASVGRSVGRSAAACVPGATPSLCSCWSRFQAPPEAPPAPPSTRR